MARKPADQSVDRETILTAAAEVVRRGGLEAATMRDIAAAVNLTAASLYHHFKNKDSLLLEVLEAGLDIAFERVEPLTTAPLPYPDRLRAMIIAHVTAVTDYGAVSAAMVFEIRRLLHLKPPPANGDRAAYDAYAVRRSAFFARRDAFERLFRDQITAGVRDGAFRPVDTSIIVKAIIGANNWIGVWYKPEGRLSGEAIGAIYADLMLSGLRSLPHPPTPSP